MWSEKRRKRWPSDTTRRLVRMRRRYRKVWNCERKPSRTGRSGEAHQFARELVEGMKQTIAQASSGKQRPHALRGAAKTVGEGTLYRVEGLMMEGSLLKLAIGLGESRRTLRVAVAQVPNHTATDNRG